MNKEKQQMVWFIFYQDKLLFDKNTKLIEDPGKLPLLHTHEVGQYQQITCQTALLSDDTEIPDDYLLLPLRQAFNLVDEAWLTPIIRSHNIINWEINHQYCGRCGNRTLHSNQLEKQCQACKLTFYPRISPCIIVLIKKGNQILLARSPHFAPGVFALIAGFVEAGENLEIALKREVKEEVNLEVTNLQYFGSQMWPFPDSLMIGFIADWHAGEIKIDGIEIESANWYTMNNLPKLPEGKISISRKMIDYAIANLSKEKQMLSHHHDAY